MPAIRVRGLTKHFGQAPAVDGLSFEVEDGTVCGCLGPNGAGKTTTLRILAGLVRQDTGEAHVGGRPCATRRGDRLAGGSRGAPPVHRRDVT